MTTRKRTKPEERATAELRELLLEMEIAEQRQALQFHTLQARMIPDGWHGIEREVPVRPRKVRVTAAYDEDLVKWFRAMGVGYQARMNAVLRAYMAAVKARVIESKANLDWKGEAI